MRTVALLILCGLSACVCEAKAPLTDEEVVESALQMWPEDGPMSQCDYDVAHLTIEYTDSVEAQCSGLSEEACLVYAKDAPVMYLLDKGRTDDQRTALIVHETAHLLLACSGRSDVDSGHTIADVWGKWVPETAQALAY